MLETNTSNPSGTMQSIIAADIIAYAKEFNLPVKQVIQDINSSTKVSVSTLDRIVKKSKSPQPFVRTVVSIYSFILKTKSLSEIIIKTPIEISDYIKKDRASYTKDQDMIVFDTVKEDELTRDDLFNRIYTITSGDFGTDIGTVRYNFGLLGLVKLDEMIELGFVVVDQDERLKRGRPLSWNREAMVNFNHTLGDQIKKMKDFDLNEENLCSFQTYEVTQPDAVIIKKIFKDATYAAIAVAAKSEVRENNHEKLSFSALVASAHLLKGDE